MSNSDAKVDAPKDLNQEIKILQKEIEIFKKKEQDYIQGIRQRNDLIMQMSNIVIGETMKLTEATAIVQKTARNAMDMIDPPRAVESQDIPKQIPPLNTHGMNKIND